MHDEARKVLVYTHGRRDQNTVALTFDDGPNPPRTDEVLEILASRNVRATFFVIGKWVDRWPQAFERIIEAGHVIGNHGYVHDPHVGDFERAEAVLKAFTGKQTAHLRPPYLRYSLCLQSQLAMSSRITLVDADVNPADYSRSSADEILSIVLNSRHLRGGSIINLHDGSENEDDAMRLQTPTHTIAMLPRLIDEVRGQGFAFVGLDEMELVDPRAWNETDFL